MKNIESIVKKYKLILVFMRVLAILMCFIFLYLVYSRPTILIEMIFGWLFIIFLVAYIYLFHSKIEIDKKISKVFWENCDVDEYSKILEVFFRKKLLAKKNYNLAQGGINYFRGNFLEALQYLKTVSKQPEAIYYKATSYLFLKNSDLFMRESKNILNLKHKKNAYKIRQKLNLMNKIFILKTDCSIEIADLQPMGNVGEIEKMYLSAINNLNIGRKDEAIKILKIISSMDYDLFFVKDSASKLEK